MSGFAASCGFILLTGSRMSFMSLGIVSVLMLFPLVKRPGILIAGGIVVAILIPIIASVEEGAGARLTELHSSGRVDIWWDYLHTLMDRPLGLFGTSGHDGLMDEIIGNHAHNAWIDMLYVGGGPLFIMMLAPAILAAKSILRTWRARKLFVYAEDQMTIHAAASIMVAMFLQSMTNQTLYYPTYTWAFLGMVFFMFFISFREDLARVEVEAWEGSEAWEYDQTGEWDEASIATSRNTS
jgi:O-antigen ligase